MRSDQLASGCLEVLGAGQRPLLRRRLRRSERPSRHLWLHEHPACLSRAEFARFGATRGYLKSHELASIFFLMSKRSTRADRPARRPRVSHPPHHRFLAPTLLRGPSGEPPLDQLASLRLSDAVPARPWTSGGRRFSGGESQRRRHGAVLVRLPAFPGPRLANFRVRTVPYLCRARHAQVPDTVVISRSHDALVSRVHAANVLRHASHAAATQRRM